MTTAVRQIAIGVWDRMFDSLERTSVLDEIRREVYPSDYADGLKALSMVMVSELRWCAGALQLRPGSRFADLGCGLGGPGLWMARATSSKLLGIDHSHVAVRHASSRGGACASYLAADAARFPIRSGCFDGALAVDVLQCLPDLPGALGELARTLRPGARLAATTRESRHSGASGFAIADHAPLLRAAGFELLRREEPEGWEARHRAYYSRILERRDEIRVSAGEDFERAMARDAENVLSVLGTTRRVLLVAERRD